MVLALQLMTIQCCIILGWDVDPVTKRFTRVIQAADTHVSVPLHFRHD